MSAPADPATERARLLAVRLYGPLTAPQRPAQRQPGPSWHVCTCAIPWLACNRHIYATVTQKGASS